MTKPKVTVIGSINMDMVTQTDTVPEQGETVMGTGFQTAFGGKGANQAVASARLGADVTMIGRVGDDAFGTLLKDGLRAEGISVASVEPVTHSSSGVATILLSEQDNRIIVTPGLIIMLLKHMCLVTRNKLPRATLSLFSWRFH